MQIMQSFKLKNHKPLGGNSMYPITTRYICLRRFISADPVTSSGKRARETPATFDIFTFFRGQRRLHVCYSLRR